MKNKETNENPKFDKLIYKKGIIPNLLCALLIYSYSVLFLLLRQEQFIWTLVIAAVITLGAEFLVSPLTNPILTDKLTVDLENWKKGKINNIKERTELYLDIAVFPIKKSFQTHIYFFTCALLLAAGYRYMPQLRFNLNTVITSLSGCIYGAFVASLLALSYSEEICSDFAKQIIKQGIDTDLIREKKAFGLPLSVRCFLYLILPWFYMLAITFFMSRQYFSINLTSLTDKQHLIIRNIIITIINSILYIKLYTLFRKKLCDSAAETGTKLETISEKKGSPLYIETNLFDSLEYGSYLIDETSENFTNLLAKTIIIIAQVRETANNLAAISKELQTTANEQNVRISESNATVKDMNLAMQNISSKIQNVASGCDKMNKNIFSSLESIKENLNQIIRIGDSNKRITECVEALSNQIESIDNVMNIIEDIASQTRIIAFNAELEAVGAGKNGKSFHIVSIEIKRLADNVVTSIREIQNHIKDLKSASASLSASSANTTTLINSEAAMSKEIEKHFTQIKESADITSGRAEEIKDNIEKQTSSFAKIVQTLDSLNRSVGTFTVSTAEISSAANQIQSASAELESLE